MSWYPGIREKTYLAGTHLSSGPEDIRQSVSYLETADYVRGGEAIVSRAPAWATATTAAPDSPRKWRFDLRYRVGATSSASAEYFTLQRVAAGSGLVDLCIFTPIVETFSILTGKTSFRLSAGIAVRESGATGAPGVLPTTLTLQAGYAAYATEVYADNVAISPTWESARDTNGRQAFTPALTYGWGSVIKVVYVPVFTVRRVSADPSFPPPHRESLTLVLESF